MNRAPLVMSLHKDPHEYPRPGLVKILTHCKIPVLVYR
jgi:hypothetical protein